jgi:parallel beta-helix repeat protein
LEKPEKDPSVEPRTFYVGGSGPGNYSSIQDAIDAASSGDTVFVYSGTYCENIIVDKSIRLVGENKNTVIVYRPEKLCYTMEDVIKVLANNVEITGFTVNSRVTAYEDTMIGINITSYSGNFIHDNNIINSRFYGVYLYNSSYNVIEYNNFIRNDVGIGLFKSRENRIRYNNITLSSYYGIWLWLYSKNNVVSFNNFIENGKTRVEGTHVLNMDKRCKNQWDRNYWDDYVGLKFKRLADLNRDGIGSIPYRISRFESDQHPMMKPYNNS